MEPLVSRVYDLKVAGYDDSFQKVTALTAAFDRMDASKRKLNEQLQKKLDSGDATAIQQLTAKIKDLETNMKKLSVQKEASAKETLLLAKAETEAARAAGLRTKSIIDQEKELDRQIAAEAKQEAALRKQKEIADAMPGTYARMNQEYKEALKLYQTTPDNSPLFDQVKQKAIAAKAEVDKFNRSLSPDGTLVGEYKSGIINAFKNLGLTDIIKKQKDDINNQLSQLRKEATNLAQQYKKTGDEGKESFAKVDKQLQENIQHQEKLKSSLHNIDAALVNTGGIGHNIVESINHGFGHLTSSILTSAGAFIGIQSSFHFLEDSIEKFEKAEMGVVRLENAVHNLGGNEKDLKMLSDAVTELTGKFSYLSKTEVRDAEEKLVKFGKLSSDQIKKFLPTIVDLAANQRQTITETTDSLLSAVEGNARALRKLGINIKDAKSESERFALIQEQLTIRVKGSAEIFQNSAAGAAETYRRKLAGLKVQIGEQLMPVYHEFLHLSIKGVEMLKAINFANLIKGLATLVGLWIAYRTYLLAANAVTAVKMSLMVAERVAQTGVTVAIATNTLAEETNGKAKKANIIVTYLAVAAQKAYALATEGAAIATRLFNNVVKVTPLGLILTVLGLLVTGFSAFAMNVKHATFDMMGLDSATARAALKARELQNVMADAQKSLVEQKETIKQLVEKINDENTSLADKKKALKELIALDPDYLKGLKLSKEGHLEGAKAIDDYVAALERKAIAEASQSKLTDLAKEEIDLKTQLLDSQKQLQDVKLKNVGDIIKEYRRITGKNGELPTFDEMKKVIDVERARAKIASRAAQGEVDINENSIEELNSDIEKANKKLDELAKKKDALRSIIKDQGDTSKITFNQEGGLKDNLKGVEEKEKKSATERLKAAYDAEKKDLEAIRDDKIITEKEFYLQLHLLDGIYRYNKLANLKAANKEERQQQKAFNAELAKDIAETEKKLYDLAKKGADDRLAIAKADAQDKLSDVTSNPNASPVTKLEAQLTYQNEIIEAQRQFNEDMLLAEQQYGFKSVKEEEKRQKDLLKLEKEYGRLRNELRDAMFKQNLEKISAAESFKKNLIEAEALQKELSNLRNKNQSDREREIEQQRINNGKIAANINNEIESVKKQIAAYTLRYGILVLTNKEYQALLVKLKQLQVEQEKNNKSSESIGKTPFSSPSDSNTQELLTKKLSDKLNLNTDESKALGAIIASGWNTALDAMHSYFDQERQRIEESRQLAYDRIDLEKQQRLAQADGQAERDSIERQAEAKKKEAARKAGEELKKTKRAEAKIAFAMEVANIWSSVMSLPFPFSIIAGALLTGLAGVRYANTIGAINSQKFAGGGKVLPMFADGGAVDVPNGRITTRPNIATQPNGDNVFATVKTGEVILNEDQQKRLGGARTFASIGVPGFAAGGFTGLGNIPLGDGLTAPVNPSGFLGASNSAASNNASEMSELRSMVGATASLVQENARQMRTMKVQVVAKEVDDTNENRKRASAVGTLG